MRNPVHTCHQHTSGVLRAAPLVKTHKQGQRLPRRGKLAGEDPQTVVSVSPKEQVTMQTVYLRGGTSAQGAGNVLGSIVLGTGWGAKRRLDPYKCV